MIVLACLPPARLDRLRAALDAPHRVQVAADWEHAESIVRRCAVDVVIADPAFGGGRTDAAPIVALRARFKSMPFVIYAALGAPTAGALAALGRAGFAQLVLHDHDDERWQLEAVLASQPGVALGAALLARLEAPLRRLPAEVARAVERVIHTPAAFRGVPDLAAAAAVSRRPLYRAVERAEFASPREVIAAARALRAYALLRESDEAIEAVAEALRFSSAHHLTKTMRWATGMTTARARERVAPAELIDRLMERLVPTAVRTTTSSGSSAHR